MKSLIKHLKEYLRLLVNKIEFLNIDFESESETIATLSIRFYGKRKFVKNFKNSTEWYEYNSYKLYNGLDIKKIKTLSDYPGGKDYAYVLDLVVGAIIERPEIKNIWLSKSRENKLNDLIGDLHTNS